MTLTHIQPEQTYPRLNLSTLRLWTRNYTTRKTLRRLTSDQLADIGLTQYEARMEARKWFWQ